MATAAASAAARSFFRSSSVLNSVSRVAREAKAARAPFRSASRSPLGSRFFRCDLVVTLDLKVSGRVERVWTVDAALPHGHCFGFNELNAYRLSSQLRLAFRR
nr:protein NUCLEAR FUSION DEFECTIVE 6, chloroplastic/mitochondrial-like isoform X1 [Ipomoea batatas]GME15268.1 protein NUCLEAR FUSION DEFECTIVE 6, chloroplastic/mitochondrial-like isoform X1 [Ipomoea batatas]